MIAKKRLLCLIFIVFALYSPIVMRAVNGCGNCKKTTSCLGSCTAGSCVRTPLGLYPVSNTNDPYGYKPGTRNCGVCLEGVIPRGVCGPSFGMEPCM